MTPLQTALRILALITALFLIFLIIWLFYCRCRRGAIEPTATPGQVYYAVAHPNELEGAKYAALL
jgi:succinate dehydrogenase hydrophobic anchor subunit